MLSGTAEYALRATLYIAQHQGETGFVRSDRVAEAIGIPRNYLSKILHTLAQRRVLRSTRGPTGGFRLSEDAETLELARIVEPFDRLTPGRSCILGRPECDDRNPCPAHERWKGISDQVNRFFGRTTVGDLLRENGSLT